MAELSPPGSLFPVTYSILSAEALLEEVTATYDVGTPVTCYLLRRGLKDSYLLTTTSGRYIIRVYRAGWRMPTEIAYELELIGHLKEANVPVVPPAATRDGRLMLSLSAPEGERQMVLFPFIEAERLAWSEEHCYLAGRLLAGVHAASARFTSRHARSPLDEAFLIDRPLAALHAALADRPDDCAYLAALAARLRCRAETAAAVGLDWGVCQGAFGPRNLLIAADQTLTVLDFDRCGLGWRAYDFALFEWAVADSSNSAHREALLQGYRAVRPLAGGDLAALPLFHAIHRFQSLGLIAQHLESWGTHRMDDRLIDRELNFFRGWEADHSYRG